ncbi:MAG: YqaE/Pmp3 family membrane protein [Candidatus Pacebacteria bacterium]|nr:YqaE/Pmp3 family membrane protein [Candidatus Paceibacterota bacterium]
MRLILALFFPWLVFFTIKRPIQGIICLFLQLTLIGWIPAVIWAMYATGKYKGSISNK